MPSFILFAGSVLVVSAVLMLSSTSVVAKSNEGSCLGFESRLEIAPPNITPEPLVTLRAMPSVNAGEIKELTTGTTVELLIGPI